jgi:hypothetical protein
MVLTLSMSLSCFMRSAFVNGFEEAFSSLNIEAIVIAQYLIGDLKIAIFHHNCKPNKEVSNRRVDTPPWVQLF